MKEDRPLVVYGLREDQERFVESYLRNGNVAEAARQAGRRPATCRQWLKDPKVRSAIDQEVHQKLAGGAMGALDRMIWLATGEDVAPELQMKAAKDLLDRAGYKPEHMHTTADRRMESSNVNDMMSRIKELQAELGMEAKTINAAPKSAQDVTETGDVVGDVAEAAQEDSQNHGPEDPNRALAPPAPPKPGDPDHETMVQHRDPVNEVDIDINEDITVEDLL